jgi:uncharacterized membrane protein (UPF0127 family)
VKKILIATAFILGTFGARLTACPLELPTAAVSIKGNHLTVELAYTPAARACGLSKRWHLSKNNGMLFVYPKQSRQSYWMKNTHIPLSIAFIDRTGKIINIQKMKPDQTHEKYRALMPFWYALEVNQGWFKQHGIEAGDVVEIELPVMLNIR